jgi:hypothetical protein
LPADATFGSTFGGTLCPERSDPVSVSSGPYCHVCPPLLMGMFDGTMSLSLSLNLSASEESNQPSIQSNESSNVIAIGNPSEAPSPSAWIPTIEPTL